MSSTPATAHDDSGHLAKLARRGTASVVGAGFSATFGVLVVVIVTHGFSPTVAGTLFAATSAFLILESIALLGTDTGLVKWLPAQLAAGRTADVKRTLVISTIPVLALSLVVAAIVFVTAPDLAPYLVGHSAASTMTDILRVLALVLPITALHDMVTAATRGMGSMRPTVVVENICRLGLQALAVLVTYRMGGGSVALALAWSLPYAFGLVAVTAWLFRLIGRSARAGQVPTPWRPLAHEFWSFTAPRAISQITQAALKRSDIVMVAALASPAEAALYTAATRFVVLGQIFVQSVQQALSPQIAALFARGQTRAANSVYQAATLWSMTLSWPIYLGLAGFAQLLMVVFGDHYSVASDVVLILSLTMLLATACGPVDAVLLMAGRSWLSLRNSVIALAVDVGLNVVLIPLDGIRGAATSWAVAIVVRNVLPLLQVRRSIGLWPVTRSSMQVALAAGVCFGGVDIVTALTHFPTYVDVAILGVGALVYLIWLRSIRETLGLEAFRSALRRRGGTPAPQLAPEV